MQIVRTAFRRPTHVLEDKKYLSSREELLYFCIHSVLIIIPHVEFGWARNSFIHIQFWNWNSARMHWVLQ